nr:hypothetical protein [Oscillospiraceae bacterium]
MDKERLLRIIEGGKQVGFEDVIIQSNKKICYTYAIQKLNNSYIVYIDEYDLDKLWLDESDEEVYVYDNLATLLEKQPLKYGIIFEYLS